MRGWLIAGLVCVAPLSAHAYCEYKGVMYATTTVPQEYHDAKWVAKVRVLSGQYNWSDTQDSWAVYRLKVIETYKGDLPPTVRFFTYRNSGGFYFDNGTKGADVGTDYLVFLNPNTRRRGEPSAVSGSVWGNYPCGQSKPWAEVTAAQRAELAVLVRGTRR